MKKIFSFLCIAAVALLSQAQAPSGYYSAAKGKTGYALKTALFGIVADHTARSYDNLWTDFRTTDMREDGKVWDMYSATTNFSFGTDQAGNYKKEGDKYNREHSFPKSWFNDAKPMYTDLVHLVPSDGYVNGRRSNYPYGETKSPTYTSNQGWSKLGPCSVSGYSGTVFEPNDEYKGDFARIYFYMATAYEDKIASWSSPMLSNNKNTAYASWALQMLLRWAQQDPVSQKEIDRNNAIYGIQHNRNPFVDFPGLEQYVWGDKSGTPFNPDDFETGGGSEQPVTPNDPVFSPAGGYVAEGTEVTVTCTTEGAYIYYALNGGEEQCAYPPVKFTINEETTISAYAQLGDKKSSTVSATYKVSSNAGIYGENDFIPVTSATQLIPGGNYLIVCPSKSRALAETNTDVRSYAEIEFNDNGSITTSVNEDGAPRALLLGGSEGHWTFFDAVDHTYLGLNTNGNKLNALASEDSDNAQWSISFTSTGMADIENNYYEGRYIRYNSSAPRFACYTSTQTLVALYVQNGTQTGIASLAPAAASSQTVNVYSADGRLVRRNVCHANACTGLQSGIYIVGGRKVIVK